MSQTNIPFFEVQNKTRPNSTTLKERCVHFLLKIRPSLIIPELRLFKSTSRQDCIVELGCGDGTFLKHLSKMGFQNLTGVEYVTNYKFNFDKIIHEDIVAYLKKVPSTSVDQFVLLDVLEHLEKKLGLEVLELIFQKLRPGGRIIVRVPNIMSWSGQFNQYSDFTHNMIFTEDLLRNTFWTVGFESVTVRGSEKWIKVLIDPRRWLGGILYLFIFVFRRIWRLAFGGPKLYTSNITAVGFRPLLKNS